MLWAVCLSTAFSDPQVPLEAGVSTGNKVMMLGYYRLILLTQLPSVCFCDDVTQTLATPGRDGATGWWGGDV